MKTRPTTALPTKKRKPKAPSARKLAAERAKMLAVMQRLEEVYPEALCALEYGGDPWRLLVMGRLSAQCTDKRVNEVCQELFEVFPDCHAMADGDLAGIERIVMPCGLFHTKAANLKDASKILVDRYDGRVPDTMEDLLSLPGVGRKIANLILGDVYHKSAVVCDTHCIRICGRLGFYDEALTDPTKIETILRSLLPGEDGSDFCHRIVLFGRDVCSARNPKCDGCPLADLCAHREKEAAT